MKRSLGCLGLIKPEVDLIRTILRTSSRLDNRWGLVDEGECDALLLYNQEKSTAPYIATANTQLVMIRRRGEHYPAPVVYKPFRADELVDTLLGLEQARVQPAAKPLQDEQPAASAFRLKQWPPADVLALHKNYMLLAVYLSRGTKTLQDLITLSGQNETLCSQFLRLMQDRQLLLVERHLASVPAQPASPKSAAKKGFFALLRARLDFNKNKSYGYERI